MTKRRFATWLREFIVSGGASNYLAFIGGLQVATGISTLVLLRVYRAESRFLLAILLVVAVLFVATGFLSRKLSWEMSSLRLEAERVNLSMLKIEDLVSRYLEVEASLLGIAMSRFRRMLSLMVVDALLTAAAIVLFAGSAIWWV